MEPCRKSLHCSAQQSYKSRKINDIETWRDICFTSSVLESIEHLNTLTMENTLPLPAQVKNARTNAFLPKLFCAALVGLALSQAQAAVIVSNLGTGAPSATLGGFAMTTFPNDGIASFTSISNLNTPVGGSIGFSSAVDTRSIGNGWATWSHGYTGDVYYTALQALTITMPTDVDAFYLYAEPNIFSLFDVTVTSDTGTQTVLDVDGSGGANGFGIYGTAGTQISSITISFEAGSGGFAVGEFGIAREQSVPEPSTLALFGLASLGLGFLRRRRG